MVQLFFFLSTPSSFSFISLPHITSLTSLFPYFPHPISPPELRLPFSSSLLLYIYCMIMFSAIMYSPSPPDFLRWDTTDRERTDWWYGQMGETAPQNGVLYHRPHQRSVSLSLSLAAPAPYHFPFPLLALSFSLR